MNLYQKQQIIKMKKKFESLNKKCSLIKSTITEQLNLIFSQIFPPISHPYQKSLTEILIYCIQIGNLNCLFTCFEILIESAIICKNFDEANYWIAQANVIAEKGNDSSKIILIWIWASEVEKEKGIYEASLNCLQNALSYCSIFKSDLESDVYAKIAKCCYYMGSLQDAKRYHQKSMNFSEKTKDSNEKKNGKTQISQFNTQMLNSMWLPINSSFLEYYLNRDLTKPLIQRLLYLKQNIQSFYCLKDHFRNAKILNISEKISNNSLIKIQSDKINDKIIISHRTQNKNIAMFATAESIVPQVNLMMKRLKSALKSFYLKNTYF